MNSIAFNYLFFATKDLNKIIIIIKYVSRERYIFSFFFK